jgi:hypothetical protein
MGDGTPGEAFQPQGLQRGRGTRTVSREEAPFPDAQSAGLPAAASASSLALAFFAKIRANTMPTS